MKAELENVQKEVRKDVDKGNKIIQILREEQSKGSEVAEIMAGFRERCCQDIKAMERLEELTKSKVRLG
jgi:hypothetical protein